MIKIGRVWLWIVYKKDKQNTNADALSRILQISVLQTKASTSNNRNPNYSLFLQHALNDALWNRQYNRQYNSKFRGK